MADAERVGEAVGDVVANEVESAVAFATVDAAVAVDAAEARAEAAEETAEMIADAAVQLEIGRNVETLSSEVLKCLSEVSSLRASLEMGLTEIRSEMTALSSRLAEAPPATVVAVVEPPSSSILPGSSDPIPAPAVAIVSPAQNGNTPAAPLTPAAPKSRRWI